MNQYFLLIGIIVVIAVIVFVIERRQKGRDEAEKTEDKANIGSKVSGGFKSLRDKVTGNKPDLPEQFQAWVAKNVTTKKDEALKSWLTAFSPEENKAFTEQLDSFCANLNLDLAWVVEQQLDKDSKLGKESKDLIIS